MTPRRLCFPIQVKEAECLHEITDCNAMFWTSRWSTKKTVKMLELTCTLSYSSNSGTANSFRFFGTAKYCLSDKHTTKSFLHSCINMIQTQISMSPNVTKVIKNEYRHQVVEPRVNQEAHFMTYINNFKQSPSVQAIFLVFVGLKHL